MPTLQLFPPVTTKGRFLEEVSRLGYRHESHAFAARGPAGEPLTMDVARCGPDGAERVVVVSSGLHGVEGFFGSAVQLAWLRSRPAGWSPPGTAVVLAHALNPYGFAWLRRWNEGNVDLNRNFLDDLGFRSADPRRQGALAAYRRLAPFLNPRSPPSSWEPYALAGALRILSEGYGARARLP